MAFIPRGIFRVLAIFSTVASPISAHLVLADSFLSTGPRATLTYLLVLMQAAIVLAVILDRVHRPLHKLAAVAFVAAGVGACFYHLTGGVIVSSGMLHATAYGALLALFGTSLTSGSEPLVTRITGAIHGRLSPEVLRYTRRVTWVWCAFFGLEILMSATLLTLAPIAWWSVFVNLSNMPLILILFVGERLFRPLWLANPPRERIVDILRIGQSANQSFIKCEGDIAVAPRQP
ncbi:MAG: hypothetical protein JWM91_4467 [Rhodospirillales bacterium]|nr:hypothetical protein [Rhodospirillales bacterium]